MIHQEWKETSVSTVVLQVGDIVFSLASGVLAFFYYFHRFHLPHSYWLAILVGTILVAYVFPKYQLYRYCRDRFWWLAAQRLLMATSTAFLLLVAIGFFTKISANFSRFWFFYWFVFDLAALTLLRATVWGVLHVLKKYGKNQRKILMIGDSAVGQGLVECLKKWMGAEFIIVDWMKDIPQRQESELKDLITNKNIGEIWLCLSAIQQSEIKNILSQLSESIVTIRYFPDFSGINLREEVIINFLGFPMVNLIASPMVGINQWLKAVEDRCLSFLILVLISPLILVIALLVKLTSPGPIFYKQKRVGWNGREFDILKFRSMRPNAEANTGAVWCVRDDPRVTPIGKFLRKTNLDELPQFINVLLGDMSIVGPRPERPELIEKFKEEIPDYMKKHLVKAGITGWAQVNGWRGNTDLKKRIELDIYYIKHWSVWLDLKIILMTVWKCFFQENAY